jgi:putative SOS response-associated peptidase YedK
MPLILPKERHQDWLDVKIDETTIEGMMKPYDASEMEVHTIANKLNRLGYNTTDRTVIEPFDYPELPDLD